MILMVTYDLHNPGRDYDKIATELKTAGSWAHPQGSEWLVDTTISPSDLIDTLKAAGDASDEYFVAQLHKNWAAFRTDKDVVAWLKSEDRAW